MTFIRYSYLMCMAKLKREKFCNFVLSSTRKKIHYWHQTASHLYSKRYLQYTSLSEMSSINSKFYNSFAIARRENSTGWKTHVSELSVRLYTIQTAFHTTPVYSIRTYKGLHNYTRMPYLPESKVDARLHILCNSIIYTVYNAHYFW